jgi:hypothetical protein
VNKALERYVKLAPFVGIGIVAVVIGVLVIFYVQRGAHLELTGSVQKVRTLALDENSAAALIDFRVLNPSDYPFVVRQATVSMVEPSGKTIEGMIVADVDAQRLFEYYPAIGPKYNDTLTIRTKVNPSDVMRAAAHDGVVLGGDGNGGVCFPRFHPGLDGLFTTAKLIELLAIERVRLADVVRSLPRYHLVRGRVSCPWESKGKVMRMLAEQYRDHRVRQIDGVKIEMGREWVLVLPDPDRPLFHIIAESTSADGAQALMDKYSSLVSGLQH